MKVSTDQRDHLDYNELLLQRFSIRKPLSEAHVDGVVRRAAIVLSKLLQLIHIFLKAEELHHGVLWQLGWGWVSRTGVTGAGKHMAPVLPPGVDTSLLYPEEQTSLDAAKDAVGVFNLFLVQQTVSGGEAEAMGIELRGLLLIVELEKGSGQSGL